jgi:hypothetical protein
MFCPKVLVFMISQFSELYFDIKIVKERKRERERERGCVL